MRISVHVPFLALALHTSEAACAAGAKAFPSSHKGRGKVNYGNMFDITYRDTYKVVQYSPMLAKYWEHHENAKGKAIPPFILHQCGTTKPSLVDAGVDSPDARFFEIPVQRATIGWEGPLPWFELLGLTEHIGLIDLDHVGSPCGQLLEHCEPGIHMSSFNASWSSRANATEVVFTSSEGRGWAGPEKDVPMPIGYEQGSLHHAQWLRFVAAFFNEDARADEIFAKIEKDYEALKAMGAKLSSWEGSEWGGKRPRVLFVTWNWSPNTFDVVNHPEKFVQDAGGSLVAMPATAPEGCVVREWGGFKRLQCARPNGTAAFRALLREADVIFDETTGEFQDKRADFAGTFGVTQADVPALAREPPNIFRMDGTKAWRRTEGHWGDLLFETQHSEPQQLLAGIMEALWSKDFQSACGTKYVRRETGEQRVTSLKSCPHFDAAGSHKCKALHESFQEVPQCSSSATSAVSEETSAATGVHLASLALTAVLAPFA